MENNKKRKSHGAESAEIKTSGESNSFNPKLMSDINIEENLVMLERDCQKLGQQFPKTGQKIKKYIKILQSEKASREAYRRLKAKALEAAMNDINNSFGKGVVTRLGSAGGSLVETFPSGCLTLDIALGGGLPRGNIVEIYGPQNSGKSTLALHAVAEVQKLGGNAMLVDSEHSFDPSYSKRLGVDVENLILCQPDKRDMAFDIADRMCISGAIDLICIDSVSALTPQAEIEGVIGRQQMALQERVRKLFANASRSGCTLIFLNQIGVIYEDPEVTGGDIGLKLSSSVRLELCPTGTIKSAEGDKDVGVKVLVKVQKSKVSRQCKQAEFDLICGEGVSKLGCILDYAETIGVVSKKGSCYSYADKRLGQSRDRALQHLKENPVLSAEIEKVVLSTMIEGTGLARPFYAGPYRI